MTTRVEKPQRAQYSTAVVKDVSASIVAELKSKFLKPQPVEGFEEFLARHGLLREDVTNSAFLHKNGLFGFFTDSNSKLVRFQENHIINVMSGKPTFSFEAKEVPLSVSAELKREFLSVQSLEKFEEFLNRHGLMEDDVTNQEFLNEHSLRFEVDGLHLLVRYSEVSPEEMKLGKRVRVDPSLPVVRRWTM